MQHREQYDSDVSDTEWITIRQYLPQRGRLGPPPRYERREVFNAIMYVTKTGWLDGSAGCASSSLTQPIAVNSLLGCTSSLGVKAPAFLLFQDLGTAFAFWLSAGSSRELSLGLLTPVDSPRTTKSQPNIPRPSFTQLQPALSFGALPLRPLNDFFHRF